MGTTSCIKAGTNNDFWIDITNTNSIATGASWSVNNGATIISTAGLSNANIYIPSAGSYTVTAIITFNDCTTKTTSRTFTTGNCTCGVHWNDVARIDNFTKEEETEKEDTPTGEELDIKSISIYTNPIKDGKLNINGIANNTITNYQIITISGQIIQEGNTNTSTIDVHNLASGNYILKLITDNNTNVYKFNKIE